MSMNKHDKKELDRLAVLQEAMTGATYRQISSKLGVSLGFISSVLHEVTVEARTQIEQRWFTEFAPLSTRLRIMQLDECRRILWEIINRNNGKNDYASMQAISILNTLDSKFESIILSTNVLDRAISAQRATLISKEIDTIKQQTTAITDKTTINKDDGVRTEGVNNDTSINESISGSQADDGTPVGSDGGTDMTKDGATRNAC